MNTIKLTLLALILACVSATTLCHADDKEDAKKEISAQLELLKAQKVDELKAHVTERQKERITKESVAKGSTGVAKYTLDDLVESVESGEYQGAKTIKIKMKNGRTLTTLVLTDGKWLADTIWFK